MRIRAVTHHARRALAIGVGVMFVVTVATATPAGAAHRDITGTYTDSHALAYRHISKLVISLVGGKYHMKFWAGCRVDETSPVEECSYSDNEATAVHQTTSDPSSPVTELSALYRAHQVWKVVVHPVAASSNELDYTWTRKQPDQSTNTTTGKLHRP